MIPFLIGWIVLGHFYYIPKIQNKAKNQRQETITKNVHSVYVKLLIAILILETVARVFNAPLPDRTFSLGFDLFSALVYIIFIFYIWKLKAWARNIILIFILIGLLLGFFYITRSEIEIVMGGVGIIVEDAISILLIYKSWNEFR